MLSDAPSDFNGPVSHCRSRGYAGGVSGGRECGGNGEQESDYGAYGKREWFPKLFAAIAVLSSCVPVTRNRSGFRIPVAAIRIPFAEYRPARRPQGIPITHNRRISRNTIAYNCLRSLPMARSIPYSRMRLVTEIFHNIIDNQSPASRTSNPTRIQAAVIKVNPEFVSELPDAFIRDAEGVQQHPVVLYVFIGEHPVRLQADG